MADDGAMPVLTADAPARPLVPMRAIVYTVLFSFACIAGGLVIAYAAFMTGFIDRFAAARPSTPQMIAGALAWTFALIAPSVFLLVGLFKLVDAIELILLRRARPRPAAAVVRSLPDDHIVAVRIRLPDGRVVPELVIGPFGVAVVEELPPAGASRQSGGRWEVRVSSGKWIPIENPIDRASRDAERVRRWLAHEDNDHIVKVYATVVTEDPNLTRSADCAVTRPDELPAWIAALPVQRSLFPERRERIVELVRAHVI
jgi:hypothetical protein